MFKPLNGFLFAAVAALALFPAIGSDFYVELVVKIMILGIFAMSLDLLIGYTGLVSFGHAAFFGISGYTLAILSPDSASINLFFILPVCLLVTALVATVFGWLAVRTSGIYFIMITLALAQMVFYFFNESSEFGGSDGIFIFYRPALKIGSFTLLDLEEGLNFYYFTLAGLVLSYWFLNMLLHAPFGKVIQGVMANEARTRALGFATHRFKLVSYIIAGTVAGFAGFLEATHTGIMSPGYLSWHESGILLMIVILGGMGTLYGPVLGAFVMVLLQDWFQELSKHWLLMMGVFIILVVIYLPHGIAGLIDKFVKKRNISANDDDSPQGENV